MNATIQQLIIQFADAAGVPSSVALAVAAQESGGNQYTSGGGLVTGSSGEIGVFQLMPATAASLGVDPTDAAQNIQGGIAYLQQLFAQFGNWPQAIAAYNAGPGRVASGNIPSSTQSYVASVLAKVSSFADSVVTAADSVLAPADATGLVASAGPPVGALALGALGLLVLWWLMD